MTLNPPLSDAPKFPVTLLIALAAIAASLRFWFGHTLTGFAPASGSILHEPWTLVTSILPHVNLIHLVFNLYWWWYFATRIERAWGASRLLGVVLLLAVVSSGFEYAFLQGGIGLSGVGYGLCAMIWVVQSRSEILAGTVSRQTLQVFIAWFFICIVLTVTGMLPVANVAHGVGALCGWLLGKCIVAESRRRTAWRAALVATLAIAICGATIARPWVNLTRFTVSNAQAGVTALQESRYEDAVKHLEAARQKDPQDARVLFNLGLAYQHLARHSDALDAYKAAVNLNPSMRTRLAPTIASIIDHRIDAAAKSGNPAAVQALAEESLQWDPAADYPRKMLAWAKAAQLRRSGSATDPTHPATSTLPHGEEPKAP